MLTIFALPKAFTGKFDLIQKNAIRSWARLRPQPEIILFGDDEGTAEMAAEIGSRHEPEVARNEYSTPLVDRLFARAQAVAANELLCYVNSDIILMSDFTAAAQRLSAEFADTQFLGIGRKTNFPIDKPIEFDDPSWESNLRSRSAEIGEYVTYDSDHFLFRRGLWASMPPFAIGRCYWSSWFMYEARRRHVPMIDMTRAVVAVESKHDYSHAISTGGASRLSGPEYRANKRLFKGCSYYTTLNATHILTAHGLEPAPAGNRIKSLNVRFEYYVYFMLKGTLYPYSLPLILLARLAKQVLRFGTSTLRHTGAVSQT
jgi:hypothetical protein